MNTLTKATIAGLVGSVALASSAAPAEARGWHRGGDGAAVVGAGILGLAGGSAEAMDGGEGLSIVLRP